MCGQIAYGLLRSRCDALPKVTVRHNRLSGFSSIAMALLGVLTYLFVNSVAVFIITMLGVAMYLFYRRMNPGPRAASKRARETEPDPS
jgi:hypothetical protein